jgi:DNA invertase Pin-like site-specific DNA recombinase
VNKQTNTVIATISDALTSVIDGNNEQAVKALSSAIKALTTTKTVVATTRKPHKGAKRGPKPALNTEQVARFKTRVADGERVVDIAKAMGISTQTAYRHLRLSKANA